MLVYNRAQLRNCLKFKQNLLKNQNVSSYSITLTKAILRTQKRKFILLACTLYDGIDIFYASYLTIKLEVRKIGHGSQRRIFPCFFFFENMTKFEEFSCSRKCKIMRKTYRTIANIFLMEIFKSPQLDLRWSTPHIVLT